MAERKSPRERQGKKNFRKSIFVMGMGGEKPEQIEKGEGETGESEAIKESGALDQTHNCGNTFKLVRRRRFPAHVGLLKNRELFQRPGRAGRSARKKSVWAPYARSDFKAGPGGA